MDPAVLIEIFLQTADSGDISNEAESRVSDYKLVSPQSPKLESEVTRVQLTLQGMSPAAAEINFIKRTAAMDTYGVDPYSVKVSTLTWQPSTIYLPST